MSGPSRHGRGRRAPVLALSALTAAVAAGAAAALLVVGGSDGDAAPTGAEGRPGGDTAVVAPPLLPRRAASRAPTRSQRSAVPTSTPSATADPAPPTAPPARTLRAGMSGRDVADLQRRLAALRYQVRTATGTYDDETLHAVTAFEKVNGLPRDGVADPAVLDALAHPVSPRPRHHRPGISMEVDIAHQVAFLVRDGVVERIFDACTGGPNSPTPRGEFTVQYKIDGMRHAPLGPMWRPIYFTFTGIAFHGAEPVRTTPSSNGCVRLTDTSVNQIFPLLDKGVPVSVY
jgi:peptidoglycan hydrolase-like protein with peptidoglycan-binding domain